MSNLEVTPEEQQCGPAGSAGPELLVLDARKVWLGKTTQVARALPDRQIRMIGAWCFLDHYGPEEVSSSPGMQVWAHPHTGLQTVSWLFEGAIDHRDSVGSQMRIRPGVLGIMTAGHGIAHSELSPADKPPIMHGVQLWVALPGDSRDMEPRFETHIELPELHRRGLDGKILAGTIDQVSAPTTTHSPLSAADLTIRPETVAEHITIDPRFEYGVFVVAGSVEVEGTLATVDQLVYLGTGRTRLRLGSVDGGRVMILGGEPFTEEIVMWWNFVGRSHTEIVEFRRDWERRRDDRRRGTPRFPAVASDEEKVMEAPVLPTITLKPRPRRQG